MTSGFLRPMTFFTSTIPFATSSHLVIPARILTNTTLTLSAPWMIWSAVATCSALAPPPTSQKLAGFPPYCLTDRKSTRLNSSHLVISYAVFCLKKKKNSGDIVVHEHQSDNVEETIATAEHAGC